MKGISYQNNLTIKTKFCCTFTQNGEFSFIAKDSPAIDAFSIRDESFVFMEHDISGSGVCATIIFTCYGVKDASCSRVELGLDKSADGRRSSWC
jgi:hypothetical protein